MLTRAQSPLFVAIAMSAILNSLGCCCGGMQAGAGGYTPQPSPHIVNATDADFDNVVLAADKPVVVDFWASWCGPCATLDPTVVTLAEEFQNRVKFVRVNVDDSPETSEEYDVGSIPMLGLYHAGELIDTRVGVKSEDSLRSWLEEQISGLDEEA